MRRRRLGARREALKYRTERGSAGCQRLLNAKQNAEHVIPAHCYVAFRIRRYRARFCNGHLLRAEPDGVICSGARQGKQFTYALLNERVPETKPRSRDETLANLTRRYFTSHGPATLPDFVWWSGLTAKDANSGLEMVQRHLLKEVIDGKSYWRSSSKSQLERAARGAYLLPAFDEYLVSYKDRRATFKANNDKETSRDKILRNDRVRRPYGTPRLP